MRSPALVTQVRRKHDDARARTHVTTSVFWSRRENCVKGAVEAGAVVLLLLLRGRRSSGRVKARLPIGVQRRSRARRKPATRAPENDRRRAFPERVVFQLSRRAPASAQFREMRRRRVDAAAPQLGSDRCAFSVHGAVTSVTTLLTWAAELRASIEEPAAILGNRDRCAADVTAFVSRRFGRPDCAIDAQHRYRNTGQGVEGGGRKLQSEVF